jgi:glyoxylase-like metal-dependent hydrolase (beta-lactamase superfamily II)
MDAGNPRSFVVLSRSCSPASPDFANNRPVDRMPDRLIYSDFTDPTKVPLGILIEVMPGVMWIRLALPFALNHVNIYLIDDGEGWAVVDTGLGDLATQEVWKALLQTHIDRPLTRLIVTHFHPDHIGMAGWLAERLHLPVYMSETEYLLSRNIHLDPGALDAPHYREFYQRHGLSAEATQRVVSQGHAYLRLVTGLPPTFERLVTDDRLVIGGRDFRVFTGGGHSPEQVVLYCAADKIFFSADQVLSKISPNVSVTAIDPNGDPLNYYLRSLAALAEIVPPDALVLPGHGLPFHNAPSRIKELLAHHEARCDQISEACAAEPRTVAELVPLLFHRPLDPQQTSFAFSEILAHVNYLLRKGVLETAKSMSHLVRFVPRRAKR